MAQLNSPGVSVTVVDESFYTPAAPGTVPLIIVASQANKMNSAGTGTAPGTLAANAGMVYLLTSQMDLGATFGIPYFQTDAENNPVHGGEINEYGLQAAYSFLGVSNQAYVVRADIDLYQLQGSGNIPAGLPADGTYWWDTSTTSFGIFSWNASAATAVNGQTFVNVATNLNIITNSLYLNSTSSLDGEDVVYSPAASYGSVGSYAIPAIGSLTTLNTLWYKTYNTASDGTAGSTAGANNTQWVQVGSSNWTASLPVVSATIATPTLLTSDSLYVNNHQVTGVTSVGALVTALATTVPGVTASVQNGYLSFYSSGSGAGYNGAPAGSITLSGSACAKVGLTAGVYLAPTLTIAPHYQVPNYGSYANSTTTYGGAAVVNGYPSGSLWIKTTPVNLGANWDIEKYNGSTATWIRQTINQVYTSNQAAMAALDSVGGGINIPVGQVYVKANDTESTPPLANFKIYQRVSTGATNSTSATIGSGTFTSGTNTFQITSSQVGSSSLPSLITISFTAAGTTADANTFAQAINNGTVSLGNVVATVTSANQVTISHTKGGDIRLVDGTATPIAKLFSITTSANFTYDPSSTGSDGKYLITAWDDANSAGALVQASPTAPTTTPANGTIWYNTSTSDLDILINTGTQWVGYATVAGKAVVNPGVGGGTTDPNGPIISATQPTAQSTGSALAHGDLWLDSSNTEDWPDLYKYNYLTKTWVAVDETDHTTQNGIVFGDARWNDQSVAAGLLIGGQPYTKTGSAAPDTIVTLLSSSYVDFDAPNPALYPKGILLWNTRRSSFNVKKYVSGYNTTQTLNTRMPGSPSTLYYYPDAWITDAANDYKGVGVFGRKAQRAVVVQALNALIQSNQQIRDEDSKIFNLISCPGYLETLPALDAFNTDRGLLSFIVADAPARLTPDATSLVNWGKNVANATGDGEIGLISNNAYSAVYYPWGYTTDLMGNNIVVPPSYIMLRTIALSDNVSYPWFAPAGTRRGGVTNASSVGYVDQVTGEFMPTALNNGQRDALASIHVNPITYLGGVGLVAYGQYTRQLVASSLDRINVARLVIYLRYQLNAIAKPFIFEPNDQITRNEIKQQIEKLMLNLTAERALYDYLVVCDTTNNTPSRIDASELYVDIAIEPVKAVEFIYIPLRLENTGAIKGLSGN